VSYTRFDFAFWHPFGPAALEDPIEILERKRGEIKRNGWTPNWYELLSAGPNGVFVFCSEGRGARDPAVVTPSNRTVDCQSYRFIGDQEWQPMPEEIRVPHPFRPAGTKLASAFKVRSIVYPVEPFQKVWPSISGTELPTVEWFSLKRKGPWCQDKIPFRGEFLIRPGGTTPMRNVRAILELEPPYLAVVSADKEYVCTSASI
jgi:hypothetical protein